MKIYIGLLTEDRELRSSLGRLKDAAVPKDSSSKGYFASQVPSFSFGAWVPEPGVSQADCERFLLERTQDAKACILLVENRCLSYVENVRDATFSVVFERSQVDNNYKNFFHKTLGRALRFLGYLLCKTNDEAYCRLLALPLRNFHAAELGYLATLCRDNSSSGDFHSAVDQKLALLNKRLRPRRRTNHKQIYAVDDNQRFFVHGKEHHGRFATGEPHRPSCEMAGLFRFGCRIDELRHYNVSEGEGDTTGIEGEFVDCHGNRHRVKSESHLNMFANDYF